jgi:hypothetical protein
MQIFKLLIVSGALLGLPLTATANECSHSEPRSATLDAAGVSTLHVEAKAGELIIRGTSGSSEVRVDGKACAPEEDFLSEIELRTHRSGDTLYVEVEIPDRSWRRHSPYLDLEIEAPEHLSLEVEDSSGSLKIEGVRSLELDDNSGDIWIRDIANSVEIEDGSGELEISEVGGEIRIDDGSGSLTVEHVGGPVTIEDGSGEITIRDIEADVEIVEDGSGSIELDHIGGNVLVHEDGSGSIRAEHVAGDFLVERDGSGGIYYDHVEGNVRVP